MSHSKEKNLKHNPLFIALSHLKSHSEFKLGTISIDKMDIFSISSVNSETIQKFNIFSYN